ncbi:aminotransferase class III-fold pyridoxal phosphate-dependent enzyme, partial [Comamonas aquatica]|uniref:aminotransferase class III-fold pyridoxal phosphate-dependent enzyme n=1 Tax=Comamonas aquatica TaxID=225991 RepID=UPI0005A72308
DEVQAGFARSGKMFAFEHAGIEPDVIVMSKAVGGSLPLAVLGIKRKFDAWQPAGHTGTFRGNQMAMGTGIATLKAIRDQNLAQNAQERGDFLQAELKKMATEFPCIGNVRGRGLMLGIEIVDESQSPDHMGSLPADAKLAAAIQTACFNNQLLLEKGGRNGTVIRLLCPLIITQAECEEVLVRFKHALAEALVAVRGA